MKRCLSLIVLFMLTSSIAFACHGIVPESFEPIKKYEADFEKTIQKNIRAYSLFVVFVLRNLPQDEFNRMLLLVENDLVVSKVDPRLINRVLSSILLWKKIIDASKPQIP